MQFVGLAGTIVLFHDEVLKRLNINMFQFFVLLLPFSC